MIEVQLFFILSSMDLRDDGTMRETAFSGRGAPGPDEKHSTANLFLDLLGFFSQ